MSATRMFGSRTRAAVSKVVVAAITFGLVGIAPFRAFEASAGAATSVGTNIGNATHLTASASGSSPSR